MLDKSVYGSSEESGVVNLKTKKNAYLPCEFLIEYEKFLVIVSERSIGFIRQRASDVWDWSILKCPELKVSYSIQTGQIINHQLFLVGQQGKIFRFNLKDLIQQ